MNTMVCQKIGRNDLKPNDEHNNYLYQNVYSGRLLLRTLFHAKTDG